MSAPTITHQKIVGEIYKQLSIYLENKKCTPLISPIDVCLSNEYNPKKIYNCVEPDVIVVCDDKKVTNKYIKGAPDLVVEVLSEGSRRHDTLIKFNLYQLYHVKEYWIVDPETGVIYQYILNEKDIYTLPKMYEITEDIKVNILKDCIISLKKIIKHD